MNRKSVGQSHHRYHLRHFAISEAKASLRDEAVKTGQTVLNSVNQLLYTPPRKPLFLSCRLQVSTASLGLSLSFSAVVAFLNTNTHPQILAASEEVLAKSMTLILSKITIFQRTLTKCQFFI